MARAFIEDNIMPVVEPNENTWTNLLRRSADGFLDGQRRRFGNEPRDFLERNQKGRLTKGAVLPFPPNQQAFVVPVDLETRAEKPRGRRAMAKP